MKCWHLPGLITLYGTTYCLARPSPGESLRKMIQFRGERERERESSQWSGSHPVWPVHLSPEKKTQLKTFLHAWQSEKLLWNNQAYLTYLTVQYAWSIDCGRTRAGPRVDTWGLALFTHHSSDCIREILIAWETFELPLTFNILIHVKGILHKFCNC